ncbi:MAG TPA: CBS domain-containing protein [Gammaproteobacteria bacterium]|nr:CBS domain-containing protein [Gammaproteobacteria bacterium]
MTFFVQGLNGHERMPLERVFKKAVVEKTEATTPVRAIDENGHQGGGETQGRQSRAAQAYQSIEQIPQAGTDLLAEQIMSSPVVTVPPEATVGEALALLRGRQVRHLPVVTSAGVLAGMISDRDLLRHLGGVSEEYRQLQRGGIDEPIAKLMNAPVLSASRDTDVRHIARLFVEQRIGALPIVSDGELEGIIARSDVLRAVMRHFVLELWA